MDINQMNWYFDDWSHGKINVLKNDETEDTIYKSLFDFLDAINEPSVIVIESTFESFFRESRRNEFIERCEKEGHILLTTNPRATGKAKIKKYPKDQFPQFYEKNAKFPDELAVDLIREIAKSGYHLKVPRKFNSSDPWIAVREAACKEIMQKRNEKVQVTGPRGGVKFISKKELEADEAISNLPSFDSLSPRLQRGLGMGIKPGVHPKEYNKTVVAAALIASRHVKNVKEFDKLTGLYAHGYPSQFRSDFHYYGMKAAIKRHGDTKETRRDFRYACRWLYHQLKN